VVFSQGIPLKKKFGQHFLRDMAVVDTMISRVTLTPQTSVFEIGCGDGFLTREILATSIKQLFIFEIDEDWVNYIKSTISDQRLHIFLDNFLDKDLSLLEEDAPWTVLANLPYQVTFPILHCFHKNRHLLREGVIMVQEEVAQKIVKKRGKGYGASSIFFQYFFEWELLTKVPPSAFHPAPKVFSRLLYFKPKKDVQPIPDEEGFWKFVRACFKQPRRTLRNNFAPTHYSIASLPESLLLKRAQELTIDDLLCIWNSINV
jgi:16S rRNA (adenine1518-N6/adenine1519-N6)-dimethyltransferase